MIQTVCVCGVNDDCHTAVSARDGYTVVQCGNCGLMRTRERDDDYTELYTTAELYHVQEMEKIGREHYADRYDHDLALARDKRLPAYMREFRSLDVGCANGAFVDASRRAEWDAEGLEINAITAARAAARSGCAVHTSWDSVTGAYDLITLHDVFEHFPDPAAELARIRTHLRGLLVLDCPDGDEVFGVGARAPHHEKGRQHLHYWTATTLPEFITQRGFLVTRVSKPIIGKIVVCARKAQ